MSDNSKLSLTCRAGLVVFLFYLFTLTGIVLLTVWLGMEFAAGIVAGRSKFASALRVRVRRRFALLAAFLRCFRLPKVVEARVPLKQEDAPELFAMIEGLSLQIGMVCPSEVFLEMQLNAWARLQGWSGRRVALGLGFDLLAGLTRSELEAVLAHELTHGRITPRGFRDWLCRGLDRSVQLCRNLTALATPRRRGDKPSSFARFLLPPSTWLAETAARLIAARSRQEEFDADLGTVEMCSPDRARDTLLKVEALSRFAAKLPWRERVAQLQSNAFTAWLAKEFSSVRALETQEISAEVPDRFSTHPTLRDRLDALPPVGDPSPLDDRPAIELLPQPEKWAEKLIGKIQQTTIEQEDRDTKSLRRWARKMRTATDLLPLQVAGAWLVIASEVAGALAWIVGASLEVALAIMGVSVLGILFYHFGRFREPFKFPTPDFGLLKTTWMVERMPTEDQLREIEQTMRERLGSRKKSAKMATLEARFRQSLAECDYAPARAAARLGLELHPEWLQAHLVLAIASAWMGKAEEAAQALAVVHRSNGLRGQSVCWGVAWTDLLRGNWARAEALLEQSLSHRPKDPTLLNLRALCQSRRGKLQSAIMSARLACAPHPPNRDHAKFMIDLLLDGGYLHEAQSRLQPLDAAIPRDRELMLAAVRMNLLLRDVGAADHWAEALVRTEPPTFMLLRLAVFYELARHFEQATRFYREALDKAFYPDAYLGLARVEAERNNLQGARQYALSALNLRLTPGPCATPPLELLRSTLHQLSASETPTRFCRAWIATLAPNAAPANLAGRSFVVYATSPALAAKCFQTVTDAFSGGGNGAFPNHVSWVLAPPEHQPVGMARPGMQPYPDERDTSPFSRFQRRGLWQPQFTQAPAAVDAMHALPQCA